MLIFLSLLVGICAFAIFSAGLLALFRNSRSLSNKWFFIFTTSTTLWIPLNFFDSNFVVPFWTSLILKFDFIFALFLGWAFVEFIEVFPTPTDKAPLRKTKIPLFIVNILFAPIILKGLLITSSFNNHKLHIQYKFGFIAYVILVGFYAVYGLTRLLHKRLHADVRDRAVLNLVYTGLTVVVIANILSNLVFPLLIANRSTIEGLNVIGYLGFLVFAVFVYIAITTQRLFDIRLIVARSLGYIFSLSSLGLLFILSSFAFTNILFRNANLNTDRWIYVFLAVAVALIFPSFKRFFDKTTNKLFYRDIYDTQVLLDDLNNLLVSTYELRPLLKHSAEIIARNLKSDFFTFYVHSSNNSHRWAQGTTNHLTVKEQDLNYMHATLKSRPKLIIADEVEEKDTQLKMLLKLYNIAIIARLSSSIHEEGIGYMIIGYKKSGNIYSSQDIKVLDIIANELVIAIQNALRFEEIENFNLTLQAKVNEATKELRAVNVKLKQLDEAKEDFISMASHQLRTPLTIIKGYIMMLLEGDAGKLTAKQKNFLRLTLTNSTNMSGLVTDLLNVARIQSGKFVVTLEPINLVELTISLVDQLQEMAQSHNVSLTFEPPKIFPVMQLDEDKIKQVITNFIDNAIHYSRNNGTIKVELKVEENQAIFKVIDDGIGVSAEAKEHLFTKFFRSNEAQSVRPDGTGIGLYVTKTVIQALGGQLIFESEINKGSTFGFRLPIGSAPLSKETSSHS
jgi:signal transduction histidine kinase